jgi:hypothetical protein
VTVDGRKVVGVSQRRTRTVARFQCAAYRRWDPAALTALLAPPRPSPGDLAGAAAELAVAPATLADALAAALTRR